MKTFNYTINDTEGIHVRPAGLLAKKAKEFESVCTITKGENTKKLTQVMMMMAMGIKHGDTVTIKADGPDEDDAIKALEAFFHQHL